MSFLGGINPFKVFTNIAFAAMTGGASLYFQLAKEAFSLVADKVIERVGRFLGLPDSVINMVKAAFDAQMGNVDGMRRSFSEMAQEAGFSAAEQGALERTIGESADRLTNALIDRIREGGDDDLRALRASGGGGKSLLAAIAIALGKIADKKLNEMYAKTQELGTLDKNSSKYAQLSGEIGALGQEIQFVTNASNNAVKSIGESTRTLAGRN